MRLRVFLLLLVLLSASTMALAGTPQQAPAVPDSQTVPNAQDQPNSPALTGSYVRPGQVVVQTVVDGKPQGGVIVPIPREKVEQWFAEQRNLCFKMRSYIVERTSPTSDVTRPVGYTTCTPSSKAQLKHADGSSANGK